MGFLLTKSSVAFPALTLSFFSQTHPESFVTDLKQFVRFAFFWLFLTYTSNLGFQVSGVQTASAVGGEGTKWNCWQYIFSSPFLFRAIVSSCHQICYPATWYTHFCTELSTHIWISRSQNAWTIYDRQQGLPQMEITYNFFFKPQNSPESSSAEKLVIGLLIFLAFIFVLHQNSAWFHFKVISKSHLK